VARDFTPEQSLKHHDYLLNDCDHHI
jgi:hypothetical protein